MEEKPRPWLPAGKGAGAPMKESLRRRWGVRILLALLVIGTGLTYFFSSRDRHSVYDYTFRVADTLLSGHIGFWEPQPSWLNEIVAYRGRYYSVFPLGAVLCMVPAAVLKRMHLLQDFPSAAIGAMVAGATVFFLFQLTSLYRDTLVRRVILTLFPVLATWMWCNTAFGGAWQLALTFAVLGQTGALYFLLVKRKPILAGAFFAMAFGNRTEILLTAPLFLYFLMRGASALYASPPRKTKEEPARPEGRKKERKEKVKDEKGKQEFVEVPSFWRQARSFLFLQTGDMARFLLIPFALGICTLAYNYLRFESPMDFGYARIPGVLREPWYRHGIFSLYAIPGNATAMLIQAWRIIPRYPYVVPGGFGDSIFLSCPLLVLLFRGSARDKDIKWSSWIALGVLTFLLWIHGNSGGWQYSYRYAMVLLPWMFMIMLECPPLRRPAWEMVLFAISVAINAWATYLFLWTRYVQP